MKIVVLDFDGVINSPKTWGRYLIGDGREAIDPDKVRLVADLVEAHDAYVVISSAWRIDRSLRGLQEILYARGFEHARHRVIDVTPILPRDPRGHEIRAWLDAHPAVEAFVVLDDSSDMATVEHRFVQTNYQTGVTPADIAAADVHLSNNIATDNRGEQYGNRRRRQKTVYQVRKRRARQTA